MARIEWNIKEDSTLIKFGALQRREVFICDGEPYYKFSKADALRISTGVWIHFDDDDLVTYVKSAELKLTI